MKHQVEAEFVLGNGVGHRNLAVDTAGARGRRFANEHVTSPNEGTGANRPHAADRAVCWSLCLRLLGVARTHPGQPEAKGLQRVAGTAGRQRARSRRYARLSEASAALLMPHQSRMFCAPARGVRRPERMRYGSCPHRAR
jgi:hypothetical protein